MSSRTGIVKWFDKEKGYGFISADAGDDVFVHHSQVKGEELSEGVSVSFDIGEGQKGPMAINVHTI
ncbi:cold-shock protein [Clostridium cylindrosporum]|uniref:Cold shock protein n=1 Tax=Clostridium cylindrosporum DSM 605 TaxID=1121307 RepID=A0A0J8G6J1_CLOCY|nr:cold-shock protein [Clostridium cylindrosporum]KMT23226.1 cold shock protein [Clostridium cylindrosporum DSM 605]